MKRLLISTALVFISIFGYSQNVKVDPSGNYIEMKKLVKDSSKPTGKTFTTSKGEIFQVYISGKDKLYVIRTSKSGTQYKQYLKL